MQERFRRLHSDQCVVCESTHAESEVTCVWEAATNTRRTVFWSFLVTALTLVFNVIYTRFYRVRVVTRHGICAQCSCSLRLRLWQASVAHYPLFAPLITSLFAAAPLTVFAVAMAFCVPDLVPRFLLLWLAALVPLGLSVAGFEANRRWAIPGGLRAVGQFPFVLREVRCGEIPVTPDRAVPKPRPWPAQ